MKLIIFLFLCVLATLPARSQTIDEAKKDIYYERFETARQVLKNIISQPDPPPDAWYWLGEIYLKQKHWDSANTSLMQGKDYFVSKQFSLKEYPLLYIGLAHLLLDTGRTAEARTQIEDVLDKGKYKNAEALYAAARANIDSKNGDANWAIELLNKAVKGDKDNPALYTAIGDAYKKLIDGSNAVRYYKKALEVNPGYAEAKYKEGIIYLTQNNTEIYIDRFTQATEIDSNYTPALFDLYYYYFTRDVNKTAKYMNAYIANADPSPKHQYMVADLYYLSRKYDEAVNTAQEIINREGNEAQPRLYKLLSYSYAALKDSGAAMENIDLYFAKEDSLKFVPKDYRMKADLLKNISSDYAQTASWYRKALAAEKDSSEKLNYMIALADLQHKADNPEREALWREKIFYTKPHPSNVDIYNWGVALFSAQEYPRADSIFSIYEEKYPDQIYGYLWRAKSSAMIDTAMEKGLAVPWYKKLTEVALNDSIKNKNILIRAYNYLATYEANITKDYTAAVEYYDKMLQIDPENNVALKNSLAVRKWMDAKKNN